LASNLILAAHRAEEIDVYEAVNRQTEVVRSADGANDKFIHRCNLASYLLLAEKDRAADELLTALGDEVSRRGIDETYLIYYWEALSVANSALRGDDERARRRHSEMASFVASLNWPCAAHLRRRHELVSEVEMVNTDTMPRAEFDRLVLDPYPDEVGPGWSYYARLIPCCELSFWSDS
jgi:hypothetical protein